MIKISIDATTRSEIVDLVYEDADKVSTGLIRVLENKNNKRWLKRYFTEIHDLLYKGGKVNKDEVRKLLGADRDLMKQYIAQLGEYNKKKSDKLLNRIFRYDNFSNRDVAYSILNKMSIRVCPYCNRQYIITLKNKKVRPQFDHYYPKSEYPYLALSIFNLVPSCSICNQTKSKLNTYKEPILYPFDEEFGYDIVFITKKWAKASLHRYVCGLTDEFDVDIVNKTGILTNEVNKQVERLHLKELYNEHKDYIQDIFKNQCIYTDRKIKELFMRFPALFASIDDVKRSIYMTEVSKEKWGNRPLAKLTNDILRDIKK